ncbi:hypothetical protein EDD85DRAFT_795257 [Armillaria nabsnona]|nr:hypothetical protein EDD85DRAFT_795257 [Armillaria nabsnona]
MVEESRDNVDVLLVFAGLFSAAVTTFVAKTYQNLQADYTPMSASLLSELVLIQRAIANGSSVDAISSSPLNPSIVFVLATTDVSVNGLWFVRLIKQWLHHYVVLPSRTPRDRSFTRQFRYAACSGHHRTPTWQELTSFRLCETPVLVTVASQRTNYNLLGITLC